MKKKKLLKFFSIALLIVGLTGCSESSIKMEISGSTSVAPLMEKLTSAYTKKTGEGIVLAADGSSAGIKAAASKVSDIGMSSRPLAEDELQLGLVDYKIAIDAIGVVVSNENSISNLTVNQLHDIFSGKITNWKELGGFDVPIVLVSRESGSGTKSAFEETADLIQEDKSSIVDTLGPIVVNSTGAVIENISEKKGAIGYISVDSVDEKIKLIGVNGIVPNEETISNNQYILSRDFHLLYMKENTDVKQFIEYLKSEDGQKEIRNSGFIPGKVEQ
ncbi:phosphate ABC transporter substrate-binding protein [Mycoplasma sp. P36-A1]|uniref:phosphate ABC transporter substrate-binding protein n=1 Tax=Mycoplasma sp. P36-A1 TaxID=3252900 RepID=UPI003C2BD1E8